MARRQNPDTKVMLIALAALGGLAAAYFVTKSKKGSSLALANDAAAGNGGQLLTSSTSSPTPSSSYTPPSYTPPPAAGSSVMNHAEDRPATTKEKQQGLNWLQALIQKNGNKSIYNPFSEADLATNSFGPRSRAALAKAQEIFATAFASLPKGANLNLFAAGSSGDAVLQALVDNVTGISAAAPNAAETQALVKAAGGTTGSIGQSVPAPSIIQQQVNPLWVNTNTIAATPCPEGRVRMIRTFCNYVADQIDRQMVFGSTKGLTVPPTNELTAELLNSYRKVLAMFYWVAQHGGSGDTYFPSKALTDRIPRASNYTLIHKATFGAALGRLDPQVLDFFNARAVAKDHFGGGLASKLEDAYDALSADNWTNTPVPILALTPQMVAEEYPSKQVVYG